MTDQRQHLTTEDFAERTPVDRDSWDGDRAEREPVGQTPADRDVAEPDLTAQERFDHEAAQHDSTTESATQDTTTREPAAYDEPVTQEHTGQEHLGQESVGPESVGQDEPVELSAVDTTDGDGTLFTPDDAADYQAEWRALQADFVDDPREAVQRADELVAQVMQTLATTFNEHKHALEEQWQRGDEAQTEELRQALKRYRTFFDRLLSV
jgi:hypothetical protein